MKNYKMVPRDGGRLTFVEPNPDEKQPGTYVSYRKARGSSKQHVTVWYPYEGAALAAGTFFSKKQIGLQWEVKIATLVVETLLPGVEDQEVTGSAAVEEWSGSGGVSEELPAVVEAPKPKGAIAEKRVVRRKSVPSDAELLGIGLRTRTKSAA